MIVMDRNFRVKIYPKNFFLVVDFIMILSGVFALFEYFTIGTMLFLISTSELTKYYFDRKKRIIADSVILTGIYLLTLDDVSMVLSWFLIVLVISNILNLLLKKN